MPVGHFVHRVPILVDLDLNFYLDLDRAESGGAPWYGPGTPLKSQVLPGRQGAIMARKTSRLERLSGISRSGPAARRDAQAALVAFGVVLLTGNAIVGQLTLPVLASAAVAAIVVGLLVRGVTR